MEDLYTRVSVCCIYMEKHQDKFTLPLMDRKIERNSKLGFHHMRIHLIHRSILLSFIISNCIRACKVLKQR
jgi:hypothetical protein